MNRAERRRLGVSQAPPKMKHISEDAYNNAINRAYQMGVKAGYKKASNYAVVYMLAIPLLVLNEKFNEIRLREFQGHTRVEHFFDLCEKKFDKYNNGNSTIDRLLADVLEKTGFDISKRVCKQDDEQQ